jgi:hypothetical protein
LAVFIKKNINQDWFFTASSNNLIFDNSHNIKIEKAHQNCCAFLI